MRNDRVYLEYILESIERVEIYLGGRLDRADRDRLNQDPLIQDAVLRRLETLSDATSHLSSALKERYPDISWRRVADFRNALAHGYTGIDLDRVWDVISIYLGPLRELVERELASE